MAYYLREPIVSAKSYANGKGRDFPQFLGPAPFYRHTNFIPFTGPIFFFGDSGYRVREPGLLSVHKMIDRWGEMCTM